MFFRIAEGYGGHTQNLALFEALNTMFLDNKTVQLNSQKTMLHHIALNISLEDFESEKMRLEGLGLKVNAPYTSGGMFARCTSPTRSGVLPKEHRDDVSLSKEEFAGVCLLRCKRGIGEMLACTHPDIKVIEANDSLPLVYEAVRLVG